MRHQSPFFRKLVIKLIHYFFSSPNTGLVFRLHDISRKSKLSPLVSSEWQQIFTALRRRNYLVDYNRNELLPNNSNESLDAATVSLSPSQSILVCFQWSHSYSTLVLSTLFIAYGLFTAYCLTVSGWQLVCEA